MSSASCRSVPPTARRKSWRAASPKTNTLPSSTCCSATRPNGIPEYGVTDVRGGLLDLAKGFGMSEDAFNKCVADPKDDDAINQVAEDGATRYGINSTPSIVIDGTLRPGHGGMGRP